MPPLHLPDLLRVWTVSEARPLALSRHVQGKTVEKIATATWQALKEAGKLPAANRENKDSLKLFRDRGDLTGFFPEEGDQEAHRVMLKRLPNLDAYAPKAGDLSLWPMVKDSLDNALRLIRPVVVMEQCA